MNEWKNSNYISLMFQFEPILYFVEESITKKVLHVDEKIVKGHTVTNLGRLSLNCKMFSFHFSNVGEAQMTHHHLVHQPRRSVLHRLKISLKRITSRAYHRVACSKPKWRY